MQHVPETSLRLTYSIAEVAQATGLSAGYVYELAAKGKLQSIKVGRRVLIPAEALARLFGRVAV
jgi:excisionase family DNA binding protein